ncbi:ras association domain-containing protein 1-like [Penaeus monodon]|uniref:ras association domain-containing protein 1-like n=1 Tax=Penaeus monodon TaxID=6687 RepID=UPI0018A723A0|nr:ras association domain-containing protein 1-like [Penaeus monodon]
MLEPNETYTVNLSMTLRKADSNIANYIVVGDVSQLPWLGSEFTSTSADRSTLSLAQDPPSIYDILQEDRTMEKTLTSFYMPRDAVKAIHITSKTTTREVIVALLRKFKVVDNPQKFALYERNIDSTQSGKARLRRLGDGECPLVLALNWSAGGLTNKRLVLQENDTADIQVRCNS